MSAVQNRIIEIVNRQPEDSSYKEILKELNFDQMIERELVDSQIGRT